MFPALIDILPRAAQRDGAKAALIFADRLHSFAELNAASDRFAGGLVARGLRAGDPVTLHVPNGPDWIVAYYGVLKAGGIVNPVNVLNTIDEVGHIVRDCGARMIVSGPHTAAAFAASRPPTLTHVIAAQGAAPDGAEAFDVIAGDAPPALSIAGDAVAHIAYTSGTTGRPKGAMATHRAVAFNAAMTAQMHVRTQNDIALTALPLPHVYGNVVMNAAFGTGGSLVLFPRFVEAEMLAAIQRWRPTVMDGVPTMYFYLLANPGLAETDLSSLTRCAVGGQTMPVAKMAEVERRFGCPLIELWGMTELAGLGTTHPLYAPRRHGSIGIPLPFCETRLAQLDDPAQPAPKGEAGELQIRGPAVMAGYWNNPVATAETIGPDGWLATGDVATIDADGYIFIVDRKKEMILTAGYNVYPAEIERVLSDHPDVAIAAVGKEADEAKGEVAIAYVVLNPGARPNETELIEHCRARLAPYKAPRGVRFVADLPKTSTGKILRRELGKEKS